MIRRRLLTAALVLAAAPAGAQWCYRAGGYCVAASTFGGVCPVGTTLVSDCSGTPLATPTPTPAPTATPTPLPTATPTPLPTATPTRTPAPTAPPATPTPTATVTPTGTHSPTPVLPAVTPTPTPTPRGITAAYPVAGGAQYGIAFACAGTSCEAAWPGGHLVCGPSPCSVWIIPSGDGAIVFTGVVAHRVDHLSLFTGQPLIIPVWPPISAVGP